MLLSLRHDYSRPTPTYRRLTANCARVLAMNIRNEITFTEELFTRALSGDLSELRRVPKTDLHAHLLLSAPFEVYARSSPAVVPRPPERFFGFAEFDEYLYKGILPALRDSRAVEA